MSHLDVIRAWKDPEYRLSLNEAERALLPEHPAGLVELEDADLNRASLIREKPSTEIRKGNNPSARPNILLRSRPLSIGEHRVRP